ncbi:hypothetical protein [Variovorax sp. 54]|uniref:hypothetical protein n=1 Tax=Variovorax sp. 54 TaxID=2035212 RepID=UPI0011813788|nr:hypothetical protein [Variovorax sp. 54]
MRDIFRKLASAPHPDRETDAQQRKVKTALMQKANQAYAANDLLALLELQLQLQIDASAHRERERRALEALQQGAGRATGGTESGDRGRRDAVLLRPHGVEPGRAAIDPRKLGPRLEQHSRQLRAELSQQQRELRMLVDAAATRR